MFEMWALIKGACYIKLHFYFSFDFASDEGYSMSDFLTKFAARKRCYSFLCRKFDINMGQN